MRGGLHLGERRLAGVPPGRQWLPGYWKQVEGGYQWVPGYWGATDATQVQYLPEPPASLEQGPSSPPPSPDATWAPGMWVWQSDQYRWRPGFWVITQPGWMWVPASYSWTPNGYVYNQGYWDYPLANRGIPFAAGVLRAAELHPAASCTRRGSAC